MGGTFLYPGLPTSCVDRARPACPADSDLWKPSLTDCSLTHTNLLPYHCPPAALSTTGAGGDYGETEDSTTR
ncbi:hypothetical protein ACRRTK_003655 [Alexandromys fortis]